MGRSKKRYTTGFLSGLIAVAFIVGLFAGGTLSYLITSQRINDLENQVSTLQDQISNLQPSENIVYIFGDNTSLSELYNETKNSVVVIKGVIVLQTIFGTQYQQAQGSGFVCDHEGRMVIVTNFHVVDDAENIFVTLRNGNTYTATVLGSDPYADLAVLSTDAPENELKPLEIVSSSTLKVGDPVVAIGNPFGLTGSMTVGIVSQLGRTISESTIGFSIANIIQTSAPINPGNSGGPLLNYLGQVVGITTAIIADSQGLGFAVPSNTILREIGPLVDTGSYTQHSWLGVLGVDMNYEIAQLMDTDFTYGWLITNVVSGAPADKAGLLGGTEQAQTIEGTVMIGGDIIIAIEGIRIVNSDDFLTYLVEHTSPGQTVELRIVRNNQTMPLQVEFGTRPPPP
ncbi:MAG: trypsin-like peptidase domain-containing protein [Hadesarchaea archaeon]|nr:trypsin-like peptidase domain-containing protein [Hadesarchaea archaeon]